MYEFYPALAGQAKLRIMNNSYQKKITTGRKGFTLIEILIATAIFATVMVIAVATISSSMDYRNKLKEIRTTSEEVQRIADMITRDVRETRGDMDKITFDNTPANAKTDYKKGIILLKCNWGPSNYCQNIADSAIADSGADTMILFSKNSLSIYAVKEGKLYYLKNSTPTPDTILYDNPSDLISNDSYIISDSSNYINLDFGGYAPKASTVLLQPYLSFKIKSKTGPNAGDYDTLPSGMRGRAEIDSSVTMRNYH